MIMISVVLATYNEEKNIERCLRSVENFADEVIVVDGSSSDRTRDLAKELGAEVFITTNKQNFHINKQLAMDKAKGNLVLQLDADEKVDDQLKKFIKKISHQLETDKSREESQPVAWWIKRKNYFMGRFLSKGGQYPDPVIRLYLKGKAKLPQKNVHEQMEVDGEVGSAEGHLLHYANPTFSDYLQNSFNRYTSFTAEQLYADRVRFSFPNHLQFFIFKPTTTFLSLYLRHRGYVDGLPGFIFALFSGLHYPMAYLKLIELYERKRKNK